MTTGDGTQKLRDALAQLKALLAQVDVPEARFQQWFEQHPIVFEALGFRQWIPQPRFPLGDGRFLEPDFLVEDFNAVWSVFELKRHEATVLKNPDRRTDFRSDFSTYVQQCREYAIHFADSANRRFASDQYKINIQREVPSIIVASTDDLTDHAVARDLLIDRGNRVELRTYSEILRTLLRQLDWTSIDVARRPGIAMGVLGVFPVGSSEQVLFDFGKQRSRSRASIGLQGTKFFLSLVDADGHLQRWEVERPVVPDFANATPLELLELEVGVSAGSLYVSAHHNRRCLVQQHLPATRIALDDLAGGMAIGTDVTGKKPCNFSLVESFAYMRTLAPSERLQIYDHLDEVYHHYLSPLAVERPGRAVFRGSKWMTTAGHPLSNEPAKPTPDTTGPWGWWTSSAMVLDDGKPPPPDRRLGAQRILLPGMKS
jgi:hypothetical protein